MTTTSIVTNIPDGITDEMLLAVMHTHNIMIECLAPDHRASELRSGDPAGEGPCTYDITATTPVGTNMTYPLTLIKRSDGLDSCVEPRTPMGSLKIAAQWRIKGEQLVEEITIGL